MAFLDSSRDPHWMIRPQARAQKRTKVLPSEHSRGDRARRVVAKQGCPVMNLLTLLDSTSHRPCLVSAAYSSQPLLLLSVQLSRCQCVVVTIFKDVVEVERAELLGDLG